MATCSVYPDRIVHEALRRQRPLPTPGMASAIGYLLACLGGACEPGDVPDADLPEVSQAVPVRASTPQRLPPLREQSWLIELDVPGFLKASVAVPLGATGPRPVLVALHGRADRPPDH